MEGLFPLVCDPRSRHGRRLGGKVEFHDLGTDCYTQGTERDLFLVEGGQRGFARVTWTPGRRHENS